MNIGERDQEFQKAMMNAGYAATSGPNVARMVQPVTLRPGDVHVGDAEDTRAPVGLDLPKLLDGRLLIQGASGAGKSWTLRRLLEQTSGEIQQIVLDPEGEFAGIAETFGHQLIAAHRLDIAAIATVAARVRKHRLSIIVDLSDQDREGQMKTVAAMLRALVDAPRDDWHPVMVAIDEAHLFAPYGGQSPAPMSVRKEAIGAVTDLMSRGRKRGLTGVLATQRLARLAKSVASEVHNFMVGLNTLDLDIRRAAETIGWDASRAFDRLPMLAPGDFVSIGPAFSRSPAILRVGPVATHHVGAAPELAAPAVLDPREAAKILDIDALEEASGESAAVADKNADVARARAVRDFIRAGAFPAAGAIWGALVPLYPEGARVADLAGHLSIDSTDVAAGLAMLDRINAVEFSGEGADRAVRIERGMAT